MSEKMQAIDPERMLWYEGANYTADAVVLNASRSHVLLIQRQDTGDWALPGGFIDEGDDSVEYAATREVSEETGLSVKSPGKLVYRGRVDDPRNSETSWIETSAYLYILNDMPSPQAGDDAQVAAWHTLDDLPELYGSHQYIMRCALNGQ